MAAQSIFDKLDSGIKINDRGRAIVEILVIMAVGLPFSIPAFFLEDQQSTVARLLPVISVFASLAMTCVFARFNGYTWKDLGLGRPKSWSMTVVWGFVSAICCLIVAAVVISVANTVFVSEPDLSRFDALKNNPAMLAMGIFSAWFIAAIPEEIMYRGYMLGRLSNVFGGQRRVWIVSALAISVLFGLDHFYQGPAGIFATGFGGLLFCFVFLIFRKNLWVPIIAHGLIDTLAFISIYANANS